VSPDHGTSSRPRLLVLNQYYWPGVEATANLLTELCEALAEDYRVTVICGAAEGAESGRLERNGVDIVRVHSTSYDRTQLSRRASNYLTYLAGSVREGLATESADVVLCMTDPPFIGAAAAIVARRFRAPLVVISQDVFPEIAVEVGRLDNRLLIGLLSQLVRFYLTRADRIVAIGETMRRRLISKGAPADRVSVIPNWVDTQRLVPKPRDNEWARENGLAEKFVVMHSGNVGHAQNLETLVRAATFLRDLDDLEIVIVGYGAMLARLVEKARILEVPIRFMPYQPREVLSDSLSSADIHVVGLAPGLAGYVVPSRFYGVLSVGRPVLAAADAESETASVVREVGCGIVVPPARPELLAEAIRAAHDGELDLAEMGRRGREYVEREVDSRIAIDRYRQMLREVRAAR
jgi:glycosyltransferase involved in cell wall biosynthesis